MKEAILAYVQANEGCTSLAACEALGIVPRTFLSRVKAGVIFKACKGKMALYASTKELADEIHDRWQKQSAERRKEQNRVYDEARRLKPIPEHRREWERANYAKKKAANTAKPKPTPIVFAKPRPTKAPARGPAHLPGEPVFTNQTRRVVGPSMPDPKFSNTHSRY